MSTNLRNAFPDRETDAIDALARQVYRNYADVAMEMVKSLTIPAQDLQRRVDLRGVEIIERYLARNQAVLVTVAHQCNIEWLLLAMSLRFDYPLEAVYRPLSNRSLEAVMSTIYTRFGGTLIPDRTVVAEVMRRRDTPRILSIAPDQAPNWQDEAYWVRFLNQETGFFLAPELLAKFAGYPVVFVAMSRIERGHYRAEIRLLAEPPYRKDDHSIMQAYVDSVETQIVDHPADWFWFHNRWKRKRSLYG